MNEDNKTVTKAGSDIAKMSFEEALEALEEVVTDLEKGDANLDEAIALYVHGTNLRKHCSAKLEAAQKKIAELVAAERNEVASSAATLI